LRLLWGATASAVWRLEARLVAAVLLVEVQAGGISAPKEGGGRKQPIELTAGHKKTAPLVL
jgi:hypothetical protein